jgi:eukaryotic-like serine/threonine-protein kinase
MALRDQRVRACPTDDELQRYHAHELTEPDAAALSGHLGDCPGCAGRAARLLAEHNTWIERLRAAGPPPPTQSAQLPAPGATPPEIAGYEILQKIGQGGQGLVFRALQKSTKREVALKVLREGVYASAASRRRFEREIELAAGLSHPHIVTIFDSGVAPDGRPYFVMDYVPGLRLDRYSPAEAQIPGDRLTLFIKICQAVNFAHQRGVLHRDLKPSNILVDGRGEPHILDFGLARHIAIDEAHPVTITGQVGGTLPYLSPEQARGLPDALDVRSDVYALGVMLYELLAGVYPYPVTGDTLQVLRHIAETPPDRLRPRHGEVDDELETIVLKTLAKERERRYQTAGDLARDLDRYLAHEPIEAKRDSHLYMLRKTLRRYRVAAGVVVAFLVLIAAATVALGVMYSRQLGLRATAEHHAELAAAAEATAQRRFEQVHGLARFFVQEFDPLIAHLPGAAPAREVLVTKGLQYLDGLAQEAQEDLRLQLDLAGAYIAIGDVQGDLNAASHGDVKVALESYRKAQRMLDELAAHGEPEPPVYNTRLLCLNKIGDALASAGDHAGALASFQQALTLSQDLSVRHPDDERLQGSAISAHQRIGWILLASGQADAALAHFQRSLEFSRAQAAKHPDDLWQQRALGVALTKIAGVHYGRRELDEALEMYREFRSTAERLCATYPNDVVARRDVGVAHQWIGIILADRGESAAALDSFAASNSAFEDLLRDDPQDAGGAQMQLVTNHSKMGEIHLAAGRRDEAQRSFERTVALIEPLAQRLPDRPDVLRLQGVAYYKLAELERARALEAADAPTQRVGHWRVAAQWLQKSRAVFVDMRDRQILGPADAGVPEELASEIATGEAAAPE